MPVDEANVMVTMYAPTYTTPGFSMSQRLVIWNIVQYKKFDSPDAYYLS